jgi:hypothetical protein
MKYRLRSLAEKMILPESITVVEYEKLSGVDNLNSNDPEINSGVECMRERFPQPQILGNEKESGRSPVRQEEDHYYDHEHILNNNKEDDGYAGEEKVNEEASDVNTRKTGVVPDDYDPDLEEFYDIIPENVPGRGVWGAGDPVLKMGLLLW